VVDHLGGDALPGQQRGDSGRVAGDRLGGDQPDRLVDRHRAAAGDPRRPRRERRLALMQLGSARHRRGRAVVAELVQQRRQLVGKRLERRRRLVDAEHDHRRGVGRQLDLHRPARQADGLAAQVRRHGVAAVAALAQVDDDAHRVPGDDAGPAAAGRGNHRAPGDLGDSLAHRGAPAQRVVDQLAATGDELPPGPVQRGEQQRARGRRAHEPHRPGELDAVDPAAVGDVQDRALGQRAGDLVRGGEHRVGALGERQRGHVGMEAEVRPPRLIDHERGAGGVGDLGAGGDVGGGAVVRRGDDERGQGAGGAVKRPGQRVRGDAQRHAELLVVLRRGELGAPAAEHQAVDHRGVRVALHDHRAVAGQREAEGVVALGRAVGEKPALRRPIGAGRQQLGAVVGRRRLADVDALDVLGHVVGERAGAEQRDQLGVRAGAPLVPGHVEAGRLARDIRRDGLEVWRVGLAVGRRGVAHRGAPPAGAGIAAPSPPTP
jgi:hypothetical protein